MLIAADYPFLDVLWTMIDQGAITQEEFDATKARALS
jgi:hypothetical protein